MRFSRGLPVWCAATGVFFAAVAQGSAAEVPARKPVYVQTATLAAPEANQAAAADERFVYAIDNTVVAKYERTTRKRLALSAGAAKHLNSGFF